MAEIVPKTASLDDWVVVDKNALPRRANPNYIVAAYYFGNYHVDPRNVAAHGTNWTEWQVTQNAKARYPGHSQPRVPLWGYQDESDPNVFAQKVTAAHNSAVSVLIFDWYWYNDGSFLASALEEGYLKAPNRGDIDFAIMWANHDVSTYNSLIRNCSRVP